MNFLQMSIYGAVMILVIVLVRAFTISRLPKKTFIILWAIVMVRLLIPYSFPSILSVYSVANNYIPIVQQNTVAQAVITDVQKNVINNANTLQAQSEASISPFIIAWIIGISVCALFFTVSYIKCRREFREALPVENEFLTQWKAKINRKIEVKQSDKISTPLTYGVLKPVILMPKDTNWQNTKQLNYILTHEFIHIKRFDAVIKLVLTATLCIHWFNPLVWLMYFLANRDIEISCDESVINILGEEEKKEYALTLINMKAQKQALPTLCNNFSKNAVKERITSVMKTKKKSLIIVIAAALIVVCVTIPLATSAMPAKNADYANYTDKTFDEQARALLEKLKFDGYENMSVAEFRQKAASMLDTKENMNTIERITQNNMLYKQRDTNDSANFLFYTVSPLTAYNWESREFEGYAQSDFTAADNAMLEYFLTLKIADANKVSVKQYNDTRIGVMQELQSFVNQKTKEELQDEDAMNKALEEEIKSIQESMNTEGLNVDISYVFKPLDTSNILDYETLSEIELSWIESLAPYIPFGITYKINKQDGQTKLYLNSKEIRGIFDDYTGTWISNSAGNSTFDKNTPEIIAVYNEETGELTGLREATSEEQAQWNEARNHTSTSLNDKEERNVSNATMQDYESILKLKTKDYENVSVLDFNASLLDWANENFEIWERIIWDIGLNDIKVPLSDEELKFVLYTVNASGNENGKLVFSINTDTPREDAGFYANLYKDEYNNGTAWASLYYEAAYHIADENALTIGVRDNALIGVQNEIQKYWNNTSIDEFLKMNESDMLVKLNEIASKHSNNLINIKINNEDSIQFEKMDERNIV